MMDQNIFKVDFTAKTVAEDIDNFPNADWIRTGIEILKRHGARLISIGKVCEEIGQSETEFNKRFNGLESYIGSILDYWYEKETLTYIDMMDEITGSAEEVARTMCEIIHNIDKEDEIAIRNWAQRCPRANKALEKVDRTRIDVAIGLFHEMGFSDKEAETRAKIMYSTSIGSEYTALDMSLETKLAMIDLLIRKD